MPTPVIPSPRTWASLDLVTVPRLRADVSDAIAFLTSRPLFIGQNTTGASWGTGADNGLGLNAELADPWSMHATSGQVSGATSAQVFAPVAGWYLARQVSSVAYTGGTSEQFQAGFSWTTGGVTQTAIRGPSYTDGTGSGIIAQATDLIEQTASGAVGGSRDYILPTLYAGGGSVALGTGNPPTVSVRWVCATSGTQPLPVPPLTSVPNPITSAWLNANVRDAIRFLIYPPVCKAIYVAGSSSLPSGTLSAPSVVPLNSVTADNYGGFTTGASAKYTAPVAGRYFLYGQFNLTSGTGTYSPSCGLSVNGGAAQWGDICQFSAASALNPGASVTRRLRLNAGDTVQLTANQPSGSSVAYANGANNQTRFIAVWEGI